MHALALATFLLLALLTGNEFCVAAFIEPTLRSLPEDTQVRLVPKFAGLLGKAMPVWYAVTLLLTAVLAFLQGRQTGVWLSGTSVSLLLQLVVLAITLGLLVPRNTRLACMTAAYPRWLQDAREWDRLHWVRVVLLFAGCVVLVT